MIVTTTRNKKGREKIKTSLLVRDRLRNQRRIERIIFRLCYAQPWGFVQTVQTRLPPAAQVFSAFRMSPLKVLSISMQNPPRSAATPTIPSGQDVGAVMGMAWFAALSRLTSPPPI